MGMRVVALVDDLMDRSKVSAAVPGVEMIADPGAARGADRVVIDLARHADAISAVRGAAPDARIIAYGRHDDTAALAAARAAGADIVVPRSRFFRDPASVIEALNT